MKKILLSLFFVLLIAFSLLPTFTFSQGTWTQSANFGGIPRSGAIAFSIGTKGYVGAGTDLVNFYKDFWQWDQATNVWTQKANYVGQGLAFPVGFAIGNKGYAGTGVVASYGTPQKDFWEYDPVANIWSQKASVGGIARWHAVGFSIGNKGYIGTGLDIASQPLQDFWEYDPAINGWTKKSNFHGGLRTNAAGFSIGNKGYIGTGCQGMHNYNDLWEWDQATDTWTQKANFGGIARVGAIGFCIGSNGYIGIGDTSAGSSFSLPDFWQYNPNTNAWLQVANYGGGIREYAAAFVIGCKGYVGTGEVVINSSYTPKNDFWEFIPTLTPVFSGITNVDCFGNNTGSATVNVSDGVPSYTYSWSSAPVQTTQTASALYAGTYSVTVIDSYGCTCADTVRIVSPTGLTAAPPVITKPNCFGASTGSATIIATGGTPGYTYSWNPTGQTASTNTGLAAGIYTVTITDNNGCIITTLASVTQPPPVSAIISADTSICPGTSATNNVTGIGGTPGYTYLWMPPAETTTGIIVTPATTTTYTVLVTDTNGCFSPPFFTTVTVVQNPAASLSFTPDPCMGSVQFTDSSSNAVAWTWDFGDGGTSGIQNPLHVYPAPGSYSVTLMALSGQLGCKTTDQIVVDVPSFSQLYIPNAFSPNDDGRDDMYYVFGKCITEMTFSVYDRWGENVFKTSDPAVGWDGTYKGKMENAGVFMYDFNGTLTTGEKVNQKGNITLMR